MKQVSQGIGRSHGTVFGTRPAKRCGQEENLEVTSRVCARYVPCFSHVQLPFVALTSWILAICTGYEKRVAEPWRLESASTESTGILRRGFQVCWFPYTQIYRENNSTSSTHQLLRIKAALARWAPVTSTYVVLLQNEVYSPKCFKMEKR